MDLQTKIPLKRQSDHLIDYSSEVLLLGSCFVENIGYKLGYFKFQTLQNPLGILFHPKAIETLVENAIHQKVYTEKDVFFHNECWHCFDTHSKLSHTSKEGLLNALNSGMSSACEQIKNASHIIITLGTAWVYRFMNTNTIVANCHKVSQKQFKKELLTVDDIIKSLKNILGLIRRVNYDANIIFTISPVRHIKDGFVENMRSKAHLIAAIHQVIKGQSFYFPSYELMMDELRDYRFYTEEMLHPNPTAINYIWEQFKTVWVSDDALKTMDAINNIQKGLQHKPFNPNVEAHRKFLQKLESQKKAITLRFPHITF